MALRPRLGPGPASSSPVGRALELGIELGGSVLIGLGIGFALDRWLGTSPWLLLLFLGFGFAAAIRSLLRFANRQQAQQNDAAGPPERGRDA